MRIESLLVGHIWSQFMAKIGGGGGGGGAPSGRLRAHLIFFFCST